MNNLTPCNAFDDVGVISLIFRESKRWTENSGLEVDIHNESHNCKIFIFIRGRRYNVENNFDLKRLILVINMYITERVKIESFRVVSQLWYIYIHENIILSLKETCAIWCQMISTNYIISFPQNTTLLGILKIQSRINFNKYFSQFYNTKIISILRSILI